MKITYDPQAHASFIYFTKIGIGGVDETLAYQPLFVEHDANEQIAGLRIPENEDCEFRDRLKYLSQHPEIEYRESERELRIAFAKQGLCTNSERRKRSLISAQGFYPGE